MGAKFSRRGMIAANRAGKTIASTYETAYHLTGKYPKGWKGVRWDKPIIAMCSGESWEQVAKTLQSKLLGCDDIKQSYKLGTGSIPRECIDDKSIRQMELMSWPSRFGTSLEESLNFTSPTTPNKSGICRVLSWTSWFLMSSHQMRLSQNLLFVQRPETGKLSVRLLHLKVFRDLSESSGITLTATATSGLLGTISHTKMNGEKLSSLRKNENN